MISTKTQKVLRQGLGTSADNLPIAIAATKAIPYLLTWNCRHLANATMRPKEIWPLLFDKLVEVFIGAQKHGAI